MARWRTFTARIAMLITCGACLTWLVAWGAFILHRAEPPWKSPSMAVEPWLNPRGRQPQCRLPTARGDILFDWFGGIGYDEAAIMPLWSSGIPPGTELQSREWYRPLDQIRPDVAALYPGVVARMPAWAPLPPERTDVNQRAVVVCGWPWRALRGMQETQWSPAAVPGTRSRLTYDFPEAFVVPTRMARWTSQWLPLHPLPLGFVADTAFYALALAGTLRAKQWVSGALRSRRGRCRNCGYDRAGLARDAKCPECGSAPP